MNRFLIGPRPAMLLFVGVCGLFALVLHPWFMNWGSTSDERAQVLPGDDAPPSAYFTRGITVNAPASAIWPWLQAIGQDRAGFLSNDWLENLTGADIHNAATLRPEWLPRALGDRVPMAGQKERAVFGDGTQSTIRLVEPESAIADTPTRFVLLPQADATTRLLVRERLGTPEQTGAWWVVWDPMHFVMEQRMLRGIKERAEGQTLVSPLIEAVAHAGWALAGVGLLGVFATHHRWLPWLVVPVAGALPALMLTGDLDSGLAGFLALGITVAGALAFGWRWWPTYLVLASGVALVLLLAPDSYAAFGVLFVVVMGGALGVHQQHWSAGAVEYFTGHAAHERPNHAAATVGGHYDFSRV